MSGLDSKKCFLSISCRGNVFIRGNLTRITADTLKSKNQNLRKYCLFFNYNNLENMEKTQKGQAGQGQKQDAKTSKASTSKTAAKTGSSKSGKK